jgi:hypothetical protein
MGKRVRDPLRLIIIYFPASCPSVLIKLTNPSDDKDFGKIFPKSPPPGRGAILLTVCGGQVDQGAI